MTMDIDTGDIDNYMWEERPDFANVYIPIQVYYFTFNDKYAVWHNKTLAIAAHAHAGVWYDVLQKEQKACSYTGILFRKKKTM